MFIVQSYSLAVVMCIITMLCWGSWANTQKLASKEWRFQLFYWDYAIGVMLLALLLAFTLGSTGSGGRPFLADLRQADAKWLGSAFLGGVIFNLSNILLVAAIDIAGLAVAFPVGVGLALVLGVITTYISQAGGQRADAGPGRGRRRGRHCSGCGRLQAARQRQSKDARQGDCPVGRGRAAHGLVLQLSSPSRMGDDRSVDICLEAGKLSPYTAIVLFSAGLLGVELPLEYDHDAPAAVGRPGAAGRLLHQGQCSAARHRHPGRA